MRMQKVDQVKHFFFLRKKDMYWTIKTLTIDQCIKYPKQCTWFLC